MCAIVASRDRRERRAHGCRIGRDRSVFRRPELRQELLRALPHVGIGADAACRPCERRGQDGVVDDHRGAEGAQLVERLHEGRPGLGTQRHGGLLLLARGHGVGDRRVQPVERDARARQDEGGHAEALALRARPAFKYCVYGPGCASAALPSVRASSGSGPAITDSAIAASVTVRAMGPVLSSSQSSGAMPLMLTRPRVGIHADERARGRRHANRVAGVGAVAEHGHVRRHRGDRAARRSAGREAHVVGVAGAAERAAAVGVAVGEIRHVRDADDDRAGGAQLGCHGGVARRDQLVARHGEPRPAGSGDLPGEAGIGLDHDRHAPQRPAGDRAAGGLGIEAGRHAPAHPAPARVSIAR